MILGFGVLGEYRLVVGSCRWLYGWFWCAAFGVSSVCLGVCC